MIRPYVFGDSFYPGDPNALRKMISRFLANASFPHIEGELRAVIVPHAGYIYSGQIAAFAYRAISDYEYSSIIVLGPSHRSSFDGIALSGNDSFDTPLRDIKIDSNLSDKFSNYSGFSINRRAHEYEHSIEVQLPFIQSINSEAKIIPMLSGVIENYELFADAFANLIRNDTLFVVSSDLSHYKNYEEACKIDGETVEQILLCESGLNHEQACGADGINILLALAEKLSWRPRLFAYANSGDTGGDKQSVVGYSAIGFYE